MWWVAACVPWLAAVAALRAGRRPRGWGAGPPLLGPRRRGSEHRRALGHDGGEPSEREALVGLRQGFPSGGEALPEPGVVGCCLPPALETGDRPAEHPGPPIRRRVRVLERSLEERSADPQRDRGAILRGVLVPSARLVAPSARRGRAAARRRVVAGRSRAALARGPDELEGAEDEEATGDARRQQEGDLFPQEQLHASQCDRGLRARQENFMWIADAVSPTYAPGIAAQRRRRCSTW